MQIDAHERRTILRLLLLVDPSTATAEGRVDEESDGKIESSSVTICYPEESYALQIGRLIEA